MKYLVLGATGTLGRAMIKRIYGNIEAHGDEILCVSRDELKLSELKRDFPRVQTAVGDIRDKSSIRPHFDGVGTVFHFAALKRIPEMEAQPIESLKTNVLGTINAAECAIEAGVRYFVFSSTDKACKPINAYGASKFLSEKILMSYKGRGPVFSVYRWVNVLASRGAVVYAFKDCVENDKPAIITHSEMSRGWIKIEDAVEFVLSTYHLEHNRVRVPPIKAARVLSLLGAIGEVLGKTPKWDIAGMRPGEKLHEDIYFDAESDWTLNTDNCTQYTKEELLQIAKEIVQ